MRTPFCSCGVFFLLLVFLLSFFLLLVLLLFVFSFRLLSFVLLLVFLFVLFPSVFVLLMCLCVLSIFSALLFSCPLRCLLF